MSKPVLKNFIVNIRDGTPKFTTDTQKKIFYDFLKQYEGKKVWMTIDSRTPSRSERQNRYYWLYLNIIAAETGNDPDYLHARFKAEFLNTEERLILGKMTAKDVSTTNLNKTEFAEYLEKICRLTEVPLPDSSPFELPITHEEYEANRFKA